jgi:hypothetical protein
VRDSVAPVANAGPDIEANEDTKVNFDGSSSTDNDPAFNQTGNFAWTFEEYYLLKGSYDLKRITLNGVKVAHTFYTPGIYPVTLTVTDNSGNVDTDTLQVRVQDITKPVANGGDDRTVLQGRTVVFDAAGSTDNDPEFETTANYEWRFVYHGENIVLYNKLAEFRFNRSTPKPIEITLNVEDAAGNFGIDTIKIYVLSDPLLPHIKAVSPLDGDIDVNLDTEIWAKFNEELDPETIYPTNITGTTELPWWLEEAITVYDIHNEKVNGTIEYKPSTLTIRFIPDPGQLEYNNGYTITLKSSITDMAGNPLDGNSNSFADPPPADDYSWVFATVSVLTYPASGAENVPVEVNIRATFSGNISDLTIANSYIILLDPIGVQVEGDGYFDNGSQTIGFQPTQDLKKNSKYTVVLKTYTFPVNMTFEEIGGNISGKYTRSDLTWNFNTATRAKGGGGDDELDLNLMILWFIYLIIIIVIIIVIVIFLKRSRQDKESEPRQEQPVVEEDWSTEVAPPKPVGRKRSEAVVDWDDDEAEEDWKPRVMEWKEMEAQSRSKTSRSTKGRKPKKSRKSRSRLKKRPKRPLKPRKRSK